MKQTVALFLMLALTSSLRAQSLTDPSLRVEPWVTGLSNPTSLAFIPNASDAFVLEKETGIVRFVHGRSVGRAVLDLKVANDSEEGLLGVAVHPRFARNHRVYLYYTAAKTDGAGAIANRIDRFRWDGRRLRLDRHIIDLPAAPGPNHNGGKLAFGPDGKLYAAIGDLNRNGQTQNVRGSNDLSLSGAILRLNDNGSSPRDNPFYSRSNTGRRAALNQIYAYGVRNCFGLTFDPQGKSLWYTEPGVDRYDELNRAGPGFNSGWNAIMGPSSRDRRALRRLVELGPRADYGDPQLSWKHDVTPTALSFVSGSSLGAEYRNDLIVGDFDGRLYDLNLVSDRSRLALSGGLRDRVADNSGARPEAELQDLILGRDFGIVTDVINRPDGLFVLSLTEGTLYRISPQASASAVPAIPEPSSLALGMIGLWLAAHGRGRRKPHRGDGSDGVRLG